MMNVTLDMGEVLWVAFGGLLRRMVHYKKGLNDRDEVMGEWEPDVAGALGEYALAKMYRLPWSPTVGQLHADDVGPLQVRTARRDTDRLIIKHRDRDDKVFVLVIGEPPNYRAVGWILGRDAKREEWLTSIGDRSPQFFVPQSALHPMAELKVKA